MCRNSIGAVELTPLRFMVLYDTAYERYFVVPMITDIRAGGCGKCRSETVMPPKCPPNENLVLPDLTFPYDLPT